MVLVVLLVFGYRPFILSSESMEPLYSKGSLCLIKTTYTPDDVNVGDVIAYRSDAGALVLHRVVEIEGDDAVNQGSVDGRDPDNHNVDRRGSDDHSLNAEDSHTIIATLKGDANLDSQQVILSNVNFVGIEEFSIPWFGDEVEGIVGMRGLLHAVLIVLFILACVPRGKRAPHVEESTAARQ